MTQYKNKICWINPVTQRIVASRPNPDSGWIRCDSQFEGKIGLALYQWCCQYDWRFLHHQKIQLNDGRLLLKPRFWTADFIAVKGQNQIIIEAKGQLDKRFRDVLTMLENVGKLSEGNLIIVGQSQCCLDDISRMFINKGTTYPVRIARTTQLFRALDQTAKDLGLASGLILP